MFWEGELIDILLPGEENSNAGPDFTNARIKIGDTIWAGNVEIHVKASDWELHNHDQNAAFDNVILHIVYANDKDVYTSKGRKIPSVELQFDPRFLKNYTELGINNTWVPCAEKLSTVEKITKISCVETAGIERLVFKTEILTSNLKNTISDWEEIFYRQLARSFGFHVNAAPFELLAINLPFNILRKYKNDIFRIESLLFGVAGFLSNDYSQDAYFNQLKKEYIYLQSKYNLKTIDLHLWKFLRLRPGNFPTLRLAQFAALINKPANLLTSIIGTSSIDSMEDMLIVPLTDYWNNHYSFSKKVKPIYKNMGLDSARIIIINTIVPFLFLYGRHTGNKDMEDRALKLLESLPPEKNSIIHHWVGFDFIVKNAFDSQALIHLKNEYCDKKRCMNCRIGIKLISGQ